MSMNELIDWVNKNNSLMIQSGFTIILVLVVVYIYRMFFVVDEVENEANSEVALLNQKINQLLDQQTKAAENAQAGLVDENGEVQDVEKLKSEIFKLRELLNESEKKVFEMAPTAPPASNAFVPIPTGATQPEATGATSAVAAIAASLGAAAAPSAESLAQVEEMSKKIQQLETRLAEYDIIADDIAELSQLRSENSEMKKKLESLNSTEKTPDPVVIVAETNEITPTEKNLMEDFEKTVQKG